METWKKVLYTLLLLLVVYISLIGQYSANEQFQGDANIIWYSLIDLLIITAALMIVPFIWRLVEGKPISKEKGEKICLWNSFALFILSLVLMEIFKIGFVGGLGALIYFYINKWLFVEDGTTRENSSICNKCGAPLNEKDMFCRNCGSKREIEEPKEVYKPKKANNICSNCGTPIKENYNNCPNCGSKVNYVEEDYEEELENDDDYDHELTCSNCGAPIKEDYNNCPRCGAEFIDDNNFQKELENNNKLKCSNCGTPIKKDYNNCPNCGVELIIEEKTNEKKLEKEKKKEKQPENNKEKQPENNKEKDDSNVDKKDSDLRKLKKLFDDKIITKQEFEKEKKKILK